MLYVNRKDDEGVTLFANDGEGNNVVLAHIVVKRRGSRVMQVGIEAPREVLILRDELIVKEE